VLREITPEPKDFSLAAWPNPTNGLLTLDIDGLEIGEPYSVRAFDMSGRMIMLHQDRSLESDQIVPLDLTGLRSGIYLIIVDQEGQRKSIRIVLE
jgi:hypothetical protein